MPNKISRVTSISYNTISLPVASVIMKSKLIYACNTDSSNKHECDAFGSHFLVFPLYYNLTLNVQTKSINARVMKELKFIGSLI